MARTTLFDVISSTANTALYCCVVGWQWRNMVSASDQCARVCAYVWCVCGGVDSLAFVRGCWRWERSAVTKSHQHRRQSNTHTHTHRWLLSWREYEDRKQWRNCQVRDRDFVIVESATIQAFIIRFILYSMLFVCVSVYVCVCVMQRGKIAPHSLFISVACHVYDSAMCAHNTHVNTMWTKAWASAGLVQQPPQHTQQISKWALCCDVTKEKSTSCTYIVANEPGNPESQVHNCALWPWH